ncbi:hypothetical protein GE061_003086 [Apolygus lucorum]|uniref:Uncharacterized protein n=1 Tax=Apolygus lucorum TaxID=248454 RepID=A0A8S9X532_APOLU|nr:hypothetical protein GE061_003086 [Apolygus lucorum]
MAIVMSSRSKIVVGAIVFTFVLAMVLVIGSTAGWFHGKQPPMPAPYPLQHPYAKNQISLKCEAYELEEPVNFIMHPNRPIYVNLNFISYTSDRKPAILWYSACYKSQVNAIEGEPQPGSRTRL